MVRGRVSGCHQSGRPLVRCVRIRRGVSTVQLGQSIGADLSLPSAVYNNGPQTLLLWDSCALSPLLVYSSIVMGEKLTDAFVQGKETQVSQLDFNAKLIANVKKVGLTQLPIK